VGSEAEGNDTKPTNQRIKWFLGFRGPCAPVLSRLPHERLLHDTQGNRLVAVGRQSESCGHRSGHIHKQRIVDGAAVDDAGKRALA
jgi:hypothetical protein